MLHFEQDTMLTNNLLTLKTLAWHICWDVWYIYISSKCLSVIGLGLNAPPTSRRDRPAGACWVQASAILRRTGTLRRKTHGWGTLARRAKETRQHMIRKQKKHTQIHLRDRVLLRLKPVPKSSQSSVRIIRITTNPWALVFSNLCTSKSL